MATKGKDLESLLVRYLGKEVAKEMLAKVDSMVKQGRSAAEIERAITKDVITEVEKGVISTVIAKIGPMTPIKVQPIRTAVKAAIRPIAVSPMIKTASRGSKVAIGKK
jgi:hypothetical protein